MRYGTNRNSSKTIECDGCGIEFDHLGFAMATDGNAELYFHSQHCAETSEQELLSALDDEEAYHQLESKLLAF